MFRLPTTTDSLFIVPKVVARIGIAIASNYVAQATADAIVKDDPENTARKTAGALAGYSSAFAFNVAAGYASDVAIETIGNKITSGPKDRSEISEDLNKIHATES